MHRLIYAVISCRRLELFTYCCLSVLWVKRNDDIMTIRAHFIHWVIWVTCRTTMLQRTRWLCDNIVVIVNLALNPEAFPLKITISFFFAQNYFAHLWPFFFFFVKYWIYRMKFKSLFCRLRTPTQLCPTRFQSRALDGFQRLLFVSHQMGCLQYLLIWKRRNWVFLLSLNV